MSVSKTNYAILNSIAEQPLIITRAQLPEASKYPGVIYTLSDYNFTEVRSDGTRWVPRNSVVCLSQTGKAGEVKTGSTATMEGGLWVIPGGWKGRNGSLKFWAKVAYGASANTNQEIQLAYAPVGGSPTVLASAQRGSSTNTISQFFCEIMNADNEAVQTGGRLNSFGNGASTGSFAVGAIDTSVDFEVRLLLNTPSSAADSIQVISHSLILTFPG